MSPHKPHRTTRARLSAFALAAVVAVAACGASSETLTVYSGRSEELIGPLLESFTADTGIEVDVRFGGSAELALLIDQEGTRSPADVFISQSPGAVGFLAERDALQPIDAATIDAVDAAYRNGAALWVGVSGRVRVLVYNTTLVAESDLPDSVFDLTSPEYAGKIAVAPSNGSFQDFVTAMRDIEGDDATLAWLEGMAGNNSPEYSNNSAIVQAVGRGEVPMGLVNHYYNFRALAEDPSLATANHYFVDGDIGGLVIVTAVAIPAASNSVDAATRLVEYLLSDAAQEFLTVETFEYPLADGAVAWEGLPPLDAVAGATYDFDRLGGGLERTKELIDASGFEGS